MNHQNVDLAWTYLEQLGVQRDNGYGPVLLGRELFLRAHEMVGLENGPTNAAMLLNASIATFMWGVIEPSAKEFPLDGVEFGRLDALMWFGITTAVFVPIDTVFSSDDVPERPAFMKGSSDPMALELASFGFENLGDCIKAGRCAEELGEIAKANGKTNLAQSFFERACQMFLLGSDNQRAEIATQRARTLDNPSSPFFKRAPGSLSSTTIAGSKEFHYLRSVLKLG